MAQVTHDSAGEDNRRIDREQQLVLFQLGDEDYGVDIYSVQRLIQVPEITRVPRAPSYVEGVIDVRGDIIPVINLKQRFRFDNTEVGEDGRIVITEIGDQIVGFLVDAVSEVTRLSDADIEPPSSVVAGGEAEFISGIGKQKSSANSSSSRLIIVLDVLKVLGQQETAYLEKVSDSATNDAPEAPGDQQVA